MWCLNRRVHERSHGHCDSSPQAIEYKHIFFWHRSVLNPPPHRFTPPTIERDTHVQKTVSRGRPWPRPRTALRRDGARRGSAAASTTSPATSDYTASTSSAASRRPTGSRRSRAASTTRHKSGFYAGTWASNISWLRRRRRLQRGGSGEFDFYGGWKTHARRFRVRHRHALLLVSGRRERRAPARHQGEHLGGLRRGRRGSGSRSSTRYSVKDRLSPCATRRDRVPRLYRERAARRLRQGLTGFTRHRAHGYADVRHRSADAATPQRRLYCYNDWKIGLSYALPKDFTIGAFYTDTTQRRIRSATAASRKAALPAQHREGHRHGLHPEDFLRPRPAAGACRRAALTGNP